MSNKLILVASNAYLTAEFENDRVRIGEYDLSKDEALRLAKTILEQFPTEPVKQEPQFAPNGHVLNLDAFTPTAEEAQFIRQHQIIPAIKSLRQRTGMMLVDAKTLVEKWRDNPIPF